MLAAFLYSVRVLRHFLQRHSKHELTTWQTRHAYATAVTLFHLQSFSEVVSQAAEA